jgi:hypothetical protein
MDYAIEKRQGNGASLRAAGRGGIQEGNAAKMILQICPVKDVTSFDKYLDNIPAIDAERRYLSFLAAERIGWLVDFCFSGEGTLRANRV